MKRLDLALLVLTVLSIFVAIQYATPYFDYMDCADCGMECSDSKPCSPGELCVVDRQYKYGQDSSNLKGICQLSPGPKGWASYIENGQVREMETMPIAICQLTYNMQFLLGVLTVLAIGGLFIVRIMMKRLGLAKVYRVEFLAKRGIDATRLTAAVILVIYIILDLCLFLMARNKCK
jgi:hypothetical protein